MLFLIKKSQFPFQNLNARTRERSRPEASEASQLASEGSKFMALELHITQANKVHITQAKRLHITQAKELHITQAKKLHIPQAKNLHITRYPPT